MKDIAVVRGLALAVVLAGSARVLAGEDLGAWQPLPKEFKPAATSETRVSLHQGNTWGLLRSPQDYSNLEVAGTVTISVIRVFVDGKEVIHYVDRLEPPIDNGRVAVGVSSAARVTFSDFVVQTVDAEATLAPQPHQPRWTFRNWLGGRLFVFDDQEPILQLQHEQDPSMFAKLRPGHQPQLTFDSHWGLENLGTSHTTALMPAK